MVTCGVGGRDPCEVGDKDQGCLQQWLWVLFVFDVQGHSKVVCSDGSSAHKVTAMYHLHIKTPARVGQLAFPQVSRCWQDACSVGLISFSRQTCVPQVTASLGSQGHTGPSSKGGCVSKLDE